MSSTTQKSIDIKKSLVEAILAGLIALIWGKDLTQMYLRLI